MQDRKEKMKQQLINDILMAMQLYVTEEQLNELERVLLSKMYSVEISRRETGLSTDIDDNIYMLETIKFTMNKRDLSQKTIAQYMRTAQNFTDSVYKNMRKVEPADVEYYLSEYGEGKSRRNSNVTINNERRFLSAIFTWLKRCDFIQCNPVDNVLIRREIKKPIEYLQGVEVEKLRVACDHNTDKGKRERAVLEFLLSTGARVGEVPGIKIEDVDFITGEILLYGNKDREYRKVYLGDAARVHVKYYLDSRNDNSPYLFVTEKGSKKAIQEATYRGILNGIRNKARINRRIYPHLMRKTMASTLRQHGANTDDIADMLGHADSKVTKTYYAATAPGKLQAIHNMYMT